MADGDATANFAECKPWTLERITGTECGQVSLEERTAGPLLSEGAGIVEMPDIQRCFPFRRQHAGAVAVEASAIGDNTPQMINNSTKMARIRLMAWIGTLAHHNACDNGPSWPVSYHNRNVPVFSTIEMSPGCVSGCSRNVG